jgi:hypothetical protein
MKGYKAFNKGLICRGKQYAENTVFEESGADSCCEAGVMHFCEEPFAVLNYYDLVDEHGEMPDFAEVEALDEVLTDGDKRATKKLKIGARLKIKDLIDAQIKFVSEKCGKGRTVRKDESQVAASGYESQLATSGNRSQIAASGNRSQLAASGEWSQIAASGNGSRLAASGYRSQLAASGYGSRLAASGNGSRLAASGDESRLAASGNESRLAASGENSVLMACGRNSIAKANSGWITLAEWDKIDDKYVPVCVRSGHVGDDLKPDTWYRLENGEFVEAGE